MSRHTKWSAWQNVNKQTFVKPTPKVLETAKVQPSPSSEPPKKEEPAVPAFNLQLEETETTPPATNLQDVKKLKKQDGPKG